MPFQRELKQTGSWPKPNAPDRGKPTLNNTHVQDRMLAVYRGQCPDQIPIAIYNRYLPRGVCARKTQNLGLGIIDWYPITSLLAPPWHLLPGYLSEVRDSEMKVSYSWNQGQRLETRTYTTPVGTVSQQIAIDPTYESDWIQKYYIKQIEDYKVIQYLVENSVLHRQEDQLQTKMRDLGTDGVVLGRVDRSPYQKLLIELAGPERLLLDLHTEPEPVLELIEAMDRRMDEMFEAAVDSEVELIWQPDNITADLTPPAMYERFCLPFYEKNGQRLRDAGKRYVVHMDGRLAPLQQLIARSRFDVVESFSLPEVGGDLTLSQAQAAWPNKVVLPNFPAVLSSKNASEISAYVNSLFKERKSHAPFMLEVSEDIPPNEWQHVVSCLGHLLVPEPKPLRPPHRPWALDTRLDMPH